MKRLGILLWSLALWAATLSCKKEADTTAEDIQGRWEIIEGYRNGRPTESLSELFFDFRANGAMATNLPVTDVPLSATYTAKKGKIEQQQGEVKIEYKIEALDDSTMTLSTTLRNFSFRFVLKKI